MSYSLIFFITFSFVLDCHAMEEVSVASKPAKQLKVWNNCDEYDYADPDGMTCCQWLKYSYRKPKVVKGSSTVNPVEVKSSESLLYAVMQNKPDLVLQHILSGADVNEKASNGWAPLHYAARDRNGLVARILLASPTIDAHVKTPDGKTPLDILLERRLTLINNDTVERIDPITKRPFTTMNVLENYEKRTRFFLKLYEHFDNNTYPFLLKGDALVWKKDGKNVIA